MQLLLHSPNKTTHVHFHHPELIVPETMTDPEKLIWYLAFVQSVANGKGERKASAAAAHAVRTFQSLHRRVNRNPDPTDPADAYATIALTE